ncbi:MAG: NUDIX hydrolase [Casimicrobiaceae bacterium]
MAETGQSIGPWPIDRIRSALRAIPDGLEAIEGDGTHEDRLAAQARMGRRLRPAAVIMLLNDHGDGAPRLVLTQRSAHLADHPGQISLPGGREEPEDSGPEAAALREAAEEIGADCGRIEILGRLPRYVTITAFDITPVVAATRGQRWRPDPHEVADVFELPLAYLLDDAHWRRDRLWREGRLREYWAIPWRERYIWGATAGILRTFRNLLVATR